MKSSPGIKSKKLSSRSLKAKSIGAVSPAFRPKKTWLEKGTNLSDCGTWIVAVISHYFSPFALREPQKSYTGSCLLSGSHKSPTLAPVCSQGAKQVLHWFLFALREPHKSYTGSYLLSGGHTSPTLAPVCSQGATKVLHWLLFALREPQKSYTGSCLLSWSHTSPTLAPICSQGATQVLHWLLFALR